MAGNLDFFQKDLASGTVIAQKPFFAISKESEDVVHKWLLTEVSNRIATSSDFFSSCKNNLNAYRNEYRKEKRQISSLERSAPPASPKYAVNHLYEMTENIVSKMTRLKPAIEVLPSNDEFEDKNSAKAVSLLIKHLWYINDIDFLTQKLHRHKVLFGEAFLLVDWDKEKGDLHPDYVTLRAEKKLDNIAKTPIRTGDVNYELQLPWNVLLEAECEYDRSNTVILRKSMHVEQAKKEYPGKENKISGKKGKNSETSELVDVYCFYHKVNDSFPEGKKIVFTNDGILSDEVLGFSHGGFPLIRITDIDVPGQSRGESRYSQALAIQTAHNNLSQAFIKNEFLMAAPKWMMPRGACNIDQLANGRTIVQYQGGAAPQLVQMNPTSQHSFNFREKMELELGTIMGVHQISRGEPPKGITAAVALQFLNEQENERSSSDIAKSNNFIVELAKHSISVAGDNYETDDGRMLRILGKENKYLIKHFDSANLHKDYDVRLQNSSALPESKGARMERILHTMQYAPTTFTPERWSELLEFGSTEKMHSILTEAITSAESQVEDIIEGIPVAPPQAWEDSLTHLSVYYKKVQARSFKEEVPPQNRQALIEHIKVHEMLASEKAEKNPLFAAKLAQLDQFPMFWTLAPVPKSREQLEAEVMGAANRGEPTNEQIPAAAPEEQLGNKMSTVSHRSGRTK